LPPVSRPFVSVITDDALAGERITAIIEAACAAGCHMVQLRQRRLPASDLLALARSLRELTTATGTLLVINDRIDIALAVGADGVHLPAAGMSPARARRLLGPTRIVGRSAHSADEIAAFARADAEVDYLQFGPVYATASKAGYGRPQGLARLGEAVDAAGQVPVIAVGGIEENRVAEVMSRGAAGVAVIAAVMASNDPGAATGALVSAVGLSAA